MKSESLSENLKMPLGIIKEADVPTGNNEDTFCTLLGKKSVEPPELTKYFSSSALVQRDNPIVYEKLENNNNSEEWVITPKKKQTRQNDKATNNVQVQKMNHSKIRNGVVSPILLKKKLKPFSKEDETEVKKSEEPTTSNTDLEMLNVSLTTPCKIVLEKLDESKYLLQKTPDDLQKKPDMERTPRTPAQTPSRITSRNSTAKKSARKKLMLTPSSSVPRKPVGSGFLTPTLNRRLIENATSPLDKARISLQAAEIPESLPCRNVEFENIKTFVLRNLINNTGGCMYISGVPGTGKTATVHSVVKHLQQESLRKTVPAFNFIEVNGLRLTEPRQAYVRLWQTLNGTKLSVDAALKCLETKFRGRPNQSTLILVDELDYLCNRRQDVIYNILEWSSKQYSKLIVLTIANTMDLPERTLKGKITSRMGLTRLVFEPYKYQHLQEIVMNRLGSCKNFHPDAVSLIARKVAAVSGDARRALDICRRAIENLDITNEETITVFSAEKVLTNIFSGVNVQAIKNCSLMCKMILRAVRDEVLRTGVEETTFASVYNQLDAICTLEGHLLPTYGQAAGLCNILVDSGLILADKVRFDLKRKITLNVSPEEVGFALQC